MVKKRIDKLFLKNKAKTKKDIVLKTIRVSVELGWKIKTLHAF